jgi:DNA invertase Pin-like site-specific DNA recombinase
MKLIGYLRVSTSKQGESGLGLEAQLAAIEGFARQRNACLKQTFMEVESGSGKHNDRPELAKAIHECRVTGATLVIAKLDRLSRDAVFLLTLRDSGIEFIAADMPDANKLTVGIMALIAQHEREAISKRTREALQAAKARGTKLGNPNGAAALRRAGKGNVASLRIICAKADRHARNLKPVIEALKSEGINTLSGIAHQLNEREMLTPRGRRWYKASVKNLIARIETLPAENGLAQAG